MALQLHAGHRRRRDTVLPAWLWAELLAPGPAFWSCFPNPCTQNLAPAFLEPPWSGIQDNLHSPDTRSQLGIWAHGAPTATELFFVHLHSDSD